jgi:hypothetical protein
MLQRLIALTLLLLVLVPAGAWADITTGRVLYLRLNEGTGTSLTDSGTGSHTADVANPTWSSGATCQEGACVTLNGTSTILTIADATDLSPTNGAGQDTALTITMRIYLAGTTATQMLVEKGISGDCGMEYQLWLDNSTLYWQLWTTTLSANIGRSAPFSTTNAWVHLAAVSSGSETNAGLDIYVNGAAVDTADAASGTYGGLSNTTCDLTIGASGIPNYFVNGRLDEVKVFTRALTPTDIIEDRDALNPPALVRKRVIELE